MEPSNQSALRQFAFEQPKKQDVIDVESRVVETKKIRYPESIIVDSADIVREFTEALGPEVCKADRDLMTYHIVAAIAFEEDEADVDHMNIVPDFNRMQSTAFFKDSDKWQSATHACTSFAAKVYERFREFRLYQRDQPLNYMFQEMHEDNIVLQHIPH